MAGKNFDEIMQRFRDIEFSESFDLIVAIANGGVVPAGIINQRLQIEVKTIYIHLRDMFQQPEFDAPRLMAPVDFNYRDKKILLVDDRIKTGSSVKLALETLKEAALIRTFAVNGNADYALYNENCFRFPWIL